MSAWTCFWGGCGDGLFFIPGPILLVFWLLGAITAIVMAGEALVFTGMAVVKRDGVYGFWAATCAVLAFWLGRFMLYGFS